MSVQFGRWSFDGTLPPSDLFEKVDTMLAAYGPDGRKFHQQDGVSVLYRALHATKESRGELQPHVLRSGAVMIWDGRLDNRAEFIALMSDRMETDSPDVSVVASAYERWGTRCFERLLGDWALSIWDGRDHSLTLAKDPIGTRQLYYSRESNAVSWSTILAPLVLFAGKTFPLSEEYIAGWFSLFPAVHLTPYVGIDSVPPACFVRFRNGSRTIHRYWDFDPAKKIRYRADAEYEEHFRSVFTEAVRRRLRSDSPILAELSGGMDSSSIVCIADHLISQGQTETSGLDTISYYDDSEPNWNERPYFTKVEAKRGRIGHHVDVGRQTGFEMEFDIDSFAPTPSSRGRHSGSDQQFVTCLASRQSVVVLSGIGGDEVLGGVPTPIPELTDLVARPHLRRLIRQFFAWALAQRKPLVHLAGETVREFLPAWLIGVPPHKRPAAWLARHFVRRNRAVLHGYDRRLKILGPLPSFQENLRTIDMLRRQLACTSLPSEPPYELRYPYLDRNLLEFIYALPREQLVRPSQRRSLMRRALVGIVPDEILNRKRKAFITRAPVTAVTAEWCKIADMAQHMVSAKLGIVDDRTFFSALDKMRRGEEINLVTIMRTVLIERWLRNLGDWDVLRSATFPSLPRQGREADAPVRLTKGQSSRAIFTSSAG